jgi:hypothetical protein
LVGVQTVPPRSLAWAGYAASLFAITLVVARSM